MYRSLRDRKRDLKKRQGQRRYHCRCDYCKQLKKKRILERLARKQLMEVKLDG